MIKKMVADAGYNVACSVFTGPAVFGEEPYEIRRIAIRSSSGPFGFRLRLLTPFQYYESFRSKARIAFKNSNGKHSGNGRGLGEELPEKEPIETTTI